MIEDGDIFESKKCSRIRTFTYKTSGSSLPCYAVMKRSFPYNPFPVFFLPLTNHPPSPLYRFVVFLRL